MYFIKTPICYSFICNDKLKQISRSIFYQNIPGFENRMQKNKAPEPVKIQGIIL
jgi:hypothetical protein